ncbi:pilin [Cupriavidus metallidurans]|nr:pilin [Cupriavidus metallidurans]
MAKSKAAAAYADVAGGKTNFELAVVNGTALSVPTDIGLAAATGNCSKIEIAAPAGTGATATPGTITCTIASPGRLGSGATIGLSRDGTTGLYSCKVTVMDSKFYPDATCS